nr:unnamed protein product [Digitaria exilis]
MEREEGPGADMEALARRLRLHRSAPSPYESSDAVAPAPGAGELFRPRRAAVLVCLFRGAAGELRVILTKRSSSLSTHSGEQLALFVASFASHWVSVGASDGNLRMYTMGWSSTGFSSDNSELGAGSPDIKAFKPILNAAEVDEIFDVPLEMFLKDENRTSDELEWMGQAFTIHHFNYEKGNEKYIIWGLTAAILIHASSVVYERPPDFAEKRAKFNLPKYSKECRSMPGSEPGH